MDEAIHPGFHDTLNEYLTALSECFLDPEIRHIYALSYAERLYGASETSGPLPQFCAALLLASVLKERRETACSETEPALATCSSYDQFMTLWQSLLKQKEVEEEDDGDHEVSHQLSDLE